MDSCNITAEAIPCSTVGSDKGSKHITTLFKWSKHINLSRHNQHSFFTTDSVHISSASLQISLATVEFYSHRFQKLYVSQFPHTMPGLSSLPNEIIHQITELILPDDILNFSACCTFTRELSKTEVKKHLELARKYNHISFGDRPGDPRHRSCVRGDDPLSFLVEIFKKPHLIFYPKTMSIGSFVNVYQLVLGRQDHEIEFCTQRSREIDQLFLEHGALVETFLSECDGLEPEEWSKWREQVYRGAPIAIYVLLTAMCQHLRHIDILDEPFSPGDAIALDTMFAKIHPSHTSINTAFGTHPSIIRSLAVDFPSVHSHFKTPSFPKLPPATLPSMRTVWGSSFQMQYPNHISRPWFRGSDVVLAASSLTDIDIRQSTISLSGLEHLFSNAPQLEKFTYALGGTKTSPFKPHEIIRALSSHYPNTLEHIHITAAYAGTDTWYHGPNDLSTSLLRFTRLKYLRVDHTLFQDYSKPCPKRCFQKQQFCACHTTLPLSSVFPITIRDIVLEGPISLHRFRRMWEGMCDYKRRNGALRRFHVAESSLLDQAMREMDSLRATGVRVSTGRNIGDSEERKLGVIPRKARPSFGKEVE